MEETVTLYTNDETTVSILPEAPTLVITEETITNVFVDDNLTTVIVSSDYENISIVQPERGEQGIKGDTGNPGTVILNKFTIDGGNNRNIATLDLETILAGKYLITISNLDSTFNRVFELLVLNKSIDNIPFSIYAVVGDKFNINIDVISSDNIYINIINNELYPINISVIEIALVPK